MPEGLPTIIAALIGVIGTLVVTRFDDIVMLFRKPLNITGVWEGETYEIGGPFIDKEPPKFHQEPCKKSKYIVTIKQRGEKFTAEMLEIEVFEEGLQKTNYKWDGKIIKDYIVYDSVCENKQTFLQSTSMLFIHPRGQKMSGYFVATSSSRSPLHTWVGYAILKRKI